MCSGDQVGLHTPSSPLFETICPDYEGKKYSSFCPSLSLSLYTWDLLHRGKKVQKPFFFVTVTVAKLSLSKTLSFKNPPKE